MCGDILAVVAIFWMNDINETVANEHKNIKTRRDNSIEGDGVGGITAMDSEPAHGEHPLQSFQLHLTLHGLAREGQNVLQTPALLLCFVVKSIRCVHKYI